MGSTSVLYEQCQFNNYVNTVADLVSGDWGSIANRLVSIGTDSFLNYEKYAN
jgi:hypothetical protein